MLDPISLLGGLMIGLCCRSWRSMAIAAVIYGSIVAALSVSIAVSEGKASWELIIGLFLIIPSGVVADAGLVRFVRRKITRSSVPLGDG